MRVAIIVACVLTVLLGGALAVPPAFAEAHAPDTTQPVDQQLCIRQMTELRAVWERQAEALGGAGNVPATLVDASKREADAPKAIPIIREQLKLIDQIAQTRTMPDVTTAEMRLKAQALLFLLNDPDTKAHVARLRLSPIADDKIDAISIDLLAQQLATGADPLAQANLVDQVQKLDVDNPAQPRLAVLTYAMFRVADAQELNDRLMRLLANPLNSPAAAQAREMIDEEIRSWTEMRKKSQAARDQMKAMEGKPMTIVGTTLDAKNFTSADWKGKVILVDFWATWCGPCFVSLPELKDQYRQFHDQGIEILGVSGDSDSKLLTDFVSKNDVGWPQLFDSNFNKDTGAKLLHQYHVIGIPTVFLIDKKGILRTVDGRKNTKEMIVKLLAE